MHDKSHQNTILPADDALNPNSWCVEGSQWCRFKSKTSKNQLATILNQHCFVPRDTTKEPPDGSNTLKISCMQQIQFEAYLFKIKVQECMYPSSCIHVLILKSENCQYLDNLQVCMYCHEIESTCFLPNQAIIETSQIFLPIAKKHRISIFFMLSTKTKNE